MAEADLDVVAVLAASRLRPVHDPHPQRREPQLRVAHERRTARRRSAGRSARRPTAGRRRPSAGTGRADAPSQRSGGGHRADCSRDLSACADRRTGSPRARRLDRGRLQAYISSDDISDRDISESDAMSDPPRTWPVRRAVALHPGVAERWPEARLRDHDRRRGDLRVAAGPRDVVRGAGRLERRGLIEALEPEDRRRPYRLTGLGASTLRAQLERMQGFTRTALERLGRRIMTRAAARR